MQVFLFSILLQSLGGPGEPTELPDLSVPIEIVGLAQGPCAAPYLYRRREVHLIEVATPAQLLGLIVDPIEPPGPSLFVEGAAPWLALSDDSRATFRWVDDEENPTAELVTRVIGTIGEDYDDNAARAVEHVSAMLEKGWVSAPCDWSDDGLAPPQIRGGFEQFMFQQIDEDGDGVAETYLYVLISTYERFDESADETYARHHKKLDAYWRHGWKLWMGPPPK